MSDVQYTKYYVAFLDILGFKNLVNDPKTTCADIVDLYKFVVEWPEKFFNGASKEIKNSLKMKIMSDSICLYVKKETHNALHILLSCCVAFQHTLLTVDPSVFVRGGITVGDMYAEGDVMFGPALTEAYLLEEKNAKVPRIIIRKETLDDGMRKVNDIDAKRLSRWIFRDDDAFYAMNCWLLLKDSSDSETVARVKEWISYQLDTTIDESIRQKYLYAEKKLNKYASEIEGISNA